MQTPATAILDRAGAPYELKEYEETELTAREVSVKLGVPLDQVFKTLLATGDKTGYFLASIPGDRQMNEKKAARATGNKRVFMAPEKDLLRLTGYLRGACSPLGSKRPLPLLLDSSALSHDRIMVSAGRRGLQIWLSPDILISLGKAKIADLT